MNNLYNSDLPDGGEEMGMTDLQFRTFMLQQLRNWEEVLDLAKKTEDDALITKVEGEIQAIKTAMSV